MAQQELQPSTSKFTFGLFEADLQAGELRRSGVRIKIQSQPFKVLALLLERPGTVVTREEMQQRLWGDKTNVDFDHSLGTAINKLREALGDSAESPRFIETLARRGYRFIAPVAAVPVPVAETATVEEGSEVVEEETIGRDTGQTSSVVAPAVKPVSRPLVAWLILASVALFAAVSIVLVSHDSGYSTPAPIVPVTFSGRVSPGEPWLESFPGMATDGARIFFSTIENGRAVLSQALIGLGDIGNLDLPSSIEAPSLCDISPDGSKLLVRSHLAPAAEQALWIVPSLGGTARRVASIFAHDATWMPDGKRILYATGNDLFLSLENGAESRHFASLPGRAFWLRWSPDGKRLRFSLVNSTDHSISLWEMKEDGSHLNRVFPQSEESKNECCGSWTADGKYYIFQSARDGHSNLWALSEGVGLFHSRSSLFQITNGPLSYQGPSPARVGHTIYFLGLSTRYELLHYEKGAKQFLPYRGVLEAAGRTEFSRDGEWVAWINSGDGSVWRSRSNGKERLQLTTAPMQVFLMHWSPDNKRLVLMARMPGQPWKIYLISADGGSPSLLLNEDRNEADPDWSPDGSSIVFGRLPDLMAKENTSKDIAIYNLQSKQLSVLPQSQGMFSPRWSPDGTYIAATPLDQHRMMIYQLADHRWSTISDLSVADPVWAHDGKSIYFHSFMEEGQPIYQVSVPQGRVSRVADLGNLGSTDIVDYSFSGLAPGDVPMVKARRWTADIYSLDLDKHPKP